MLTDIFRESYVCLASLMPTTLIEQVAFFSTIMCGLGTVASTHMISNVLCLVLTFLSGSVLCLANKAEFLAFLLPVVYIGAVIILFLFVVMMIDFRLTQDNEQHLKKTIGNMIWIAACALGIGGFLWLFLGGSWPANLVLDNTQRLPDNNVLEIGKILYTTYLVPFQWTAIILLVAMLAALWLLSIHEEAHPKNHTPTRPKMEASQGVTYVDVPFRQGWSGS